MGKTLADGYLEIRPDTSKLGPKFQADIEKITAEAARRSSERFSRDFDTKVNAKLKGLNLAPIDIKANPAAALAAIASTENELRELARDASSLEVRLQTQDALNELGRMRKRFGDAGDGIGAELGARIGVSAGQGLFATFSASLKAPPPQVYAGAGILVAAMAPTLGAGIAGAVVGGVGVGGVVGGMAIAARDPRVKSTGRDLAAFVMADLESRASGFVAPMVRGIQTVRGEWALMGPDLDRIFSASRFIDPLLAGVSRGIRQVVAGAADVVAKADPVINQFSSSIGRIGGAVGRSFSLLAQDATEGASALNDITIAAESFIETVTTVVHWLAQAKGGLDSFDDVIDRGRYNLEKNLGAMLGLKGGLDLTADGFKRGSREAQAHENRVNGVATAADMLVLEQVELAKSTRGLSNDTTNAGLSMDNFAVSEATVKDRADKLKVAQQGLKDILGAVAAETSVAKTRSDALKQTMDALYGATMRNADANQGYESSWDQLTESVKGNGRTLDIHTVKGRANRDALKGLIQSSGQLYLSNIEAGQSTAQATRKHEARTVAIREEARRLGLNKTETDRLIATYGRIPPKKTTDLVLSGISRVADALLDMAAVQLHLAKGTPLSGDLKRRLARAQYGMPDTKRAHGGPLPGYAPHDRADNAEYRGTPGEWVIQRPTVRQVERKHGAGAMAYFNRYGELPVEEHRHAYGGLIRAQKANWARTVLFDTNVSKTRVPSISEAASKVAIPLGQFGNWPSSPAAQRGDSGVWRQVVALIKSGPRQGSFGNAYRPGDPKWHGSGRAVDWMGYNMDALAQFLVARRPLEFIHRTRTRDYAYTRGRNKGSFNNALMEAHRNHIHIAMGDGGVIDEPVVGLGRSGRTYEFGERGPEHVVPGRDMDEAVAVLRQLVDQVARVGADVATALTTTRRGELRRARTGWGTT